MVAVKPRWIALLFVLAACWAVFASRSSDPNLLRDTDTRVLLAAVRERQDPLGWFAGDWPLGNHFYRPISTLAFEFDNAVWGDNAAGYGATNAIIASLCVLALFWFLAECFASLGVACGGALLFALWLLDHGARVASILGWLWAPIGLLTLLRYPIDWRKGLAAILVSLCLAYESAGVQLLWFRSIGWLPGRTATVMTLFALASLASFARFEALRSAGVPVRSRWGWLALAVVGCALAMGSYEQAVMLPACVLGVSVVRKLRGSQPCWSAHAWFWLVLAAYLMLHRALVPSEVSSYQAQQLRDGPGVLLSIYDYLFPAATSLNAFASYLEIGWISLLIAGLYRALLFVAQNVAGYVSALRLERPVFAAGWGLSLLAFLPMAWVKPFEHYHFWPMAMRTALVLGLALTLSRLLAPSGSEDFATRSQTGTP